MQARTSYLPSEILWGHRFERLVRYRREDGMYQVSSVHATYWKTYLQTRHLSTQLGSRERTGGRLLWSTTLLLPTPLSDSHVSISLVIHGLWWTVSGQVKAHVVLACTNGVSPNHLPVIVASDRPWTTLSTRMPVNKFWKWTESTPRSGWWRGHMAGIYCDCSTREIIILKVSLLEFTRSFKRSLIRCFYSRSMCLHYAWK